MDTGLQFLVDDAVGQGVGEALHLKIAQDQLPLQQLLQIVLLRLGQPFSNTPG